MVSGDMYSFITDYRKPILDKSLLEKNRRLEEPDCWVLPATPLVFHWMELLILSHGLRSVRFFQMWAGLILVQQLVHTFVF